MDHANSVFGGWSLTGILIVAAVILVIGGGIIWAVLVARKSAQGMKNLEKRTDHRPAADKPKARPRLSRRH